MIFIVHGGLYVLFVIGVLLFIAARQEMAGRFTAGCRAAAYGLVASLFGLVLPFVLVFGLERVCRHHDLAGGGGEYGDSLALPLLLVFGPVIGPAVAFVLTVVLSLRRLGLPTRSGR